MSSTRTAIAPKKRPLKTILARSGVSATSRSSPRACSGDNLQGLKSLGIFTFGAAPLQPRFNRALMHGAKNLRRRVRRQLQHAVFVVHLAERLAFV